MKQGQKPIAYLACGGMELSWLYAWSAFIMTSVLHRPFPLPEGIGTLALAAVFGFVAQGRGWRVIHILGLHVMGFILAALRIIYVFNYSSHPFLSQRWLAELLTGPRDPTEWLILFLILFLILMFWIRGIALGCRPLTYLTVCSRFDLGAGAFFLLLVIKLLVLVKAGVKLHDPTIQLLLFGFFIFGLLAIGLIRIQGDTQRDYLSGYRGIGVILSFSGVVLLFGSGLVLLCLPYLTVAAEIGYAMVEIAAKTLEPVVISILRFLFFHGRSRRVDTPRPTGGGNELELFSGGESSWWMEFLEKILGWGLLGLGGLIVLLVSGLGAWFLFRWLLSKTPTSERPRGQWDQMSLWIARIRAVLFFLWAKIVRRVRSCGGAVQLYTALLHWGHHSGLPHFLHETPKEYGSRLKNQFPAVNREIELIIEGFNQEVYGEMELNEQQRAMARLAWRRLRSPLHWPTRLRSWFVQPGGKGESSQ